VETTISNINGYKNISNYNGKDSSDPQSESSLPILNVEKSNISPSDRIIDKFTKINQNSTSNYIDQLLNKNSQKKQNNSIKNTNNPTSKNQLTDSEQKQVEELKKIDQKVKAHEQAHLSAGAGLVRGGASFEYATGPDGKLYAVAGEVKIDISPIQGKPQETIRKMERVVSAALAPADPSPQDRAVASTARNIEMNALIEATKNIVDTFNVNSNSIAEKENTDKNQVKPDLAKFTPSDKPINPYPSLKNEDAEQNYYQKRFEETYSKQQKLDSSLKYLHSLI
jgi:hypothetical protein